MWARYAPNSYECSSKGDKRFSALFATLSDGRTLEEAYQLDIKGYRSLSDDWRFGKGKPPIVDKTQIELFAEYLALWETWAVENPDLIEELEVVSRGKVLTDMFATSHINQAHALSLIIDRMRSNAKLPFAF
jgi:hypothetical protein